MKITRDGKEYELTRTELEAAYRECDRNYMEEDIRSVIEDEDFEEEYGITETEARELIPKIKVRYEKNLNNSDSWYYHLGSAILTVIKDYKAGKE